jgi:hypothetical protein
MNKNKERLIGDRGDNILAVSLSWMHEIKRLKFLNQPKRFSFGVNKRKRFLADRSRVLLLSAFIALYHLLTSGYFVSSTMKFSPSALNTSLSVFVGNLL